ncbi:oxidoreductase C-terminal domain-containing protein [Ralstonia chuxiongensis]|uniref:oxidoreductase C-terminal domain-containing protein n=1 Tax=Ralstonia chuxiongensis TaxID=2957504 RepID=UPI0037426334
MQVILPLRNNWVGRRLRRESWKNAQEQGIAAPKCALGQRLEYDLLPWFWLDQHDTNLQIYSIRMPAHQMVMRGNPAAGSRR